MDKINKEIIIPKIKKANRISTISVLVFFISLLLFVGVETYPILLIFVILLMLLSSWGMLYWYFKMGLTGEEKEYYKKYMAVKSETPEDTKVKITGRDVFNTILWVLGGIGCFLLFYKLLDKLFNWLF